MRRRKALGLALQNLRESRNIDRATAATRAGVSFYTWQRWEQGKVAIPLDRIADIAYALEQDPIANREIRAELRAVAA